MVGAQLPFGKWPLLLIPVYVLGAFGIIGRHAWGNYLVSASFLLYVVLILRSCYSHSTRPLQATLTVIGLSVLAISPFLSIHDPVSAILVLWGGFGSLIFAAGGQFIHAFLGGRNLAGRSGICFIFFHLGSNVMLLTKMTSALDYSCYFSLAGVFAYLLATDAPTWFRSWYTKPLGLAFVCGYLWVTVAWGLQLRAGISSADLTLHLLATGWAATLVFAVSAQVIGFLTGGENIMPTRLWWWLLVLWQLVPLGRGMFHVLGLPAWFSIVVAFSSLTVLLAWAGSLWSAEWKMLRLQFALDKGEVLKTCG